MRAINGMKPTSAMRATTSVTSMRLVRAIPFMKSKSHVRFPLDRSAKMMYDGSTIHNRLSENKIAYHQIAALLDNA